MCFKFSGQIHQYFSNTCFVKSFDRNVTLFRSTNSIDMRCLMIIIFKCYSYQISLKSENAMSDIDDNDFTDNEEELGSIGNGVSPPPKLTRTVEFVIFVTNKLIFNNLVGIHNYLYFNLDTLDDRAKNEIHVLLEKILIPSFKKFFYDENCNPSLEHMRGILNCICRFINLIVAKLKNEPGPEEVSFEYWYLLRVVLDYRNRYGMDFSV
uniref:MMS22L_N domain-containing protein n=1 Tax=Heterorhabditis bacteriophora TaxID=37862 RepID=A0A1I7WZ29_HETBA